MRLSTLIFILLILGSKDLNAQQNEFSFLTAVAEGSILPSNSWLIDSNGDTTQYASFEGKWLIIDYWSYGCKPCIKAFPVINEIYQKIDHTKLEIINVFVGSDINKWEKTLKRYTIEYPSYYSGWVLDNPMLAINFQVSNETQIVTSTPQYVLISPEGEIMDKDLPEPSSREFEKALSNYIDKK